MTLGPSAFHTLALLGSLAMSACAHPTPVTTEPPRMSPVAEAPTRANAASLLRSMLELAVDTKRIEEITPEKLASELGLPISKWAEGRYGASGSVHEEWIYAVDFLQASMNGPRLDLTFAPAKGHQSASIDPGCEVDLETVDQRLQAGGFEGRTEYGEHGQVIQHTYWRAPLRVQVFSQARNTSAGRAGGACVTSFIVN